MAELILALGILYLIVTVLVLLGHLIEWTEARNFPILYSRAFRQEAARNVFMCWAWPVWIGKKIAVIYRDAFPKKEYEDE